MRNVVPEKRSLLQGFWLPFRRLGPFSGGELDSSRVSTNPTIEYLHNFLHPAMENIYLAVLAAATQNHLTCISLIAKAPVWPNAWGVLQSW